MSSHHIVTYYVCWNSWRRECRSVYGRVKLCFRQELGAIRRGYIDMRLSWDVVDALNSICCSHTHLDYSMGLILDAKRPTLLSFELATGCDTQVDAMSKWPGSVLASTSIIEEESVVAYVGVMPR